MNLLRAAVVGALLFGAPAMAATVTETFPYGEDFVLPLGAVVLSDSGWNMAETITYTIDDPPPVPASEPTSLLLLGGIVGLGLIRLRRA